MVDFTKRLGGRKAEKPSDPIELYGTLDRAHDKGPLRPPQHAILSDWYKKHKDARDIIVKLHTGQGKTLVGLLMLQSRMNAGNGPSVYLCPDNFLIQQTCEQARQFGIKTCTTDGELPEAFLNSTKIFVTSVQKLFNGLTKFGLNNQSVGVDTILMDDAHACSDIIREQCRIRIPHDEPAYTAIRDLFANDIEQQGAGTFADIINEKRDAYLPVPYWAWLERESEIASILSSNSDRKSIKFSWPILKNILANCQCIISGSAIEIEPYIAPLSNFGSYHKAKHRIFMSATVTDDAFLVKGLQLSPETIRNPLVYSKETWSGEKMIVLPSLIHEDLDREAVVNVFGVPVKKRRFGLVALVPSFSRTKDWSKLGAKIADKDTVSDVISTLRKGEFDNSIVLVNRYDGIDLPDETCRILVFDSKPHSENLIDLYQERCRPDSEATLMRTIRSVEQGMGRSVRGEKDYSVIIVVGTDIVRLLREKSSRKYLSPQMAAQIELGLEIADMAKQDMDRNKPPATALDELIRQCLNRDPSWKAFYVEQMDGIKPARANSEVLRVYEAELRAEEEYIGGDYEKAGNIIQNLMDGGRVNSDDKGWYLQERARYHHKYSPIEAQKLQISAHKKNKLLLKPPYGVTVAMLTVVSQGRAERIAKWLEGFEDYERMDLRIRDILGRLNFGIKADKFELALHELSFALGFLGERPDKEWKEGPDNLWALDQKNYVIFECKSEVDTQRVEINKREAEQMNRSCVWFEKHYPGMNGVYIIVHPATKIQSAAGFTHSVVGFDVGSLRTFTKNVAKFFKSFEGKNFSDFSAKDIQSMINKCDLSVDNIMNFYSKKLRNIK